MIDNIKLSHTWQIPHSATFLFFSSPEEEVENFDVSSLQEEALRNIEADSFWCMSKLLDGIQVRSCEFDSVQNHIN